MKVNVCIRKFEDKFIVVDVNSEAIGNSEYQAYCYGDDFNTIEEALNFIKTNPDAILHDSIDYSSKSH